MGETLPSKSPRSWGSRILIVLFAATAIPVGATLLYNFSPTEYSFYPRCIFHSVTGLHCPGCGATRCAAALLHGDLEQAFAYNPLFVLMLPFLAYGAVRIAYETWTGKRMRGYRLPGWALKVFVGVLIAYWIARNIDVYPLTMLAPHQLGLNLKIQFPNLKQILNS
jgi:hypothetical protein